uniref:Uncharacterized protein n=1 Tax=Rhizophora mucronata TaxID=61149 RepID=A0A2P2Q2Q8_RHIMU
MYFQDISPTNLIFDHMNRSVELLFFHLSDLRR